jgi:hypothetical protein
MMNNDYLFENYSESVIFNLSEGNPGAIRVLMDSLINNQNIDPENGWGSIGFVINLAAMNVRGSRIWALYKIAGHDLAKATAVIRAAQLGIISRKELNRIIDFEDGESIEALVSDVRKELKEFQV